MMKLILTRTVGIIAWEEKEAENENVFGEVKNVTIRNIKYWTQFSEEINPQNVFFRYV